MTKIEIELDGTIEALLKFIVKFDQYKTVEECILGLIDREIELNVDGPLAEYIFEKKGIDDFAKSKISFQEIHDIWIIALDWKKKKAKN